MLPAEVQEVFRKQCLANSMQWWTPNCANNPTVPHLDFSHMELKVPLWLNNGLKPVWSGPQAATVDVGAEAIQNMKPSWVQPSGACAATTNQSELGWCRKLCEAGRMSDALDLLVQRGCHVPTLLLYRMLKQCVQSKDLDTGRRIHALTGKCGHGGDAFLATQLIGLYASHGRLEDAMQVFTDVPKPNAYHWATIIFAYARHGEPAEAAQAVRLYRRMRDSSAVQPDNRVCSAVLKACAVAGDLTAGKEVHAHVLGSSRSEKPDRFVLAGLVHMYAKCGSLEDARKVFDEFPDRDVVSWTAMIAGYARQGRGQEAVHLYRSMKQEGRVRCNAVTYVCLLQAFASIGGAAALGEGKRMHKEIREQGLQQDVVVGGSLVNMYAQCGSLEDARSLFDKLPRRNVVAWTSMIAGYAQQGMGREALLLYRSMRQEGFTPPNSVTYVCLLQACASVGALDEGKQLHAEIKTRGLQEDVVVGGSLVNMYAKCGSLADAVSLLDKLPERNTAAWNALIAGYVQQGLGQKALRLYMRMQHEGFTPNAGTYVSVLQACGSVGALDEGEHVHARIREQGLQEDAAIGSSLITMYAKCGRLEEARAVFDQLSARGVVTWTAMIAGYAQQGMGEQALSLYRSMQKEVVAVVPNSVTYVCLLQACGSVGVGALDEGKQLHLEIRAKGLLQQEDDVVLGSSLITMYAKCGSLGSARALFDRLPHKNVVAWTAMIAGYAQEGDGQEALALYRRMRQDGLIPPDCVTYVCLLQACAGSGAAGLDEGRQLHAQIREQGLLQEDRALTISLISMYVKCCGLEDARSLFDKLPEKNVVAWTMMIEGYAKHGMGEEAFSLYSSMEQEGLTPDSFTYASLLQACASLGARAFCKGEQLHARIKELGLEEDVVLGGSLVNMHAKCGNLEDARILFEKLPEKNLVAWNAMIAGYAQRGMGEVALSLYSGMLQEGMTPDFVTHVCLLLACACVGLGALDVGKRLHAQIKKQGSEEELALGVSLVNMYAKCGSLEDARSVFDKHPSRDVATWTTMIAGYAQHGMGEEALGLYRRMQQEGLAPSAVTYVCLLQACASVGATALREGKRLHAEVKELGRENDVVLGGSLVNMYAKCGDLEDARSVFEKLPERNLVAWNAMIAGYAQQGMGEEALSLYSRLRQDAVTPDSVTFVCLLQACAAVAAMPLGEQLHAEIEERGIPADGILGAALVNMYAKCGSMYHAQRMFDSMHDRSIEAWGALLSGYARQGDSQLVFDLLDKMNLQGIRPNAITFLNVLTVCSHAGLVDKGRQYFKAMSEHGISANMEHYICMVDILGRAGHLDEALQLARTMPFPPDGVVWRTLLGACRKWKNVEIGQHAFRGAISVDEKDAASYVLMSNIYASSQMWEAAKELQAKRAKLGAWKKPGKSQWTDMGGVVHTFLVGNKDHPGG